MTSETWSRQRKGIRRRVTANNKAPTNWRSFLQDVTNKTELFRFFADRIVEVNTASTVIVTTGEVAQSNQVVDLEDPAPCTHEEADTRMLVHARHAVVEGNKVLLIKANDTYVVVIAVYVYPSLVELGREKMWIVFGIRATIRWIPLHDVVSKNGPRRAAGIPFFHAFSGYDIVTPGVSLMVRVVGMGSLDPEFKSHSSVELIPGGVDSACHPSKLGKMSASLLVSHVGVATHPRLCLIAKETAEAAPTLCTEYGPNGWMNNLAKIGSNSQGDC